MMMVVPPSLRGQVFLIHDNVRYARCVNFPPIPRVQRNVRNVFLLKEKAAAIFFFSADYTEHPPAAAAQCCHFQISNKSYTYTSVPASFAILALVTILLGIRLIEFGASLYVAFRPMLSVKLRQGSGKDRQGMAVKAKGLKA